ncbi:glycosyl transferase family 4 [Actinocorallia herbida]|uniref:Glycosyl transferase family 4 n=1 Tax=Actinocorallia herbida TaxID=58109 RepID=A0A3N1CNF6_9ACTN|nr:glycosyltransferase family 4 protein [Actinocorallia herbida]ROO82849.1 glycosyl transferase family 4 [Actinocorallia herbida]
MRVLYVSPYGAANEPHDAVAEYTRVLARAVARLGHRTAVLAAREPRGERPAEVVGVLGQDVRTGFRPDLVHVHFTAGAYAGRVRVLLRLLDALAAQRVPVVLTLHGVGRDLGLLRGAGRALYRRVIARCGTVVVHSNDAAGTLAALGRDAQVAVVPHFCIPPARPETSADALREKHAFGADPVLLSFGFIHPDKGLADLVRAFSLLGGDARLVVAGGVRRRAGLARVAELRDRGHLRRVRRLVARERLGERVTFTGFVPAAEVAAWFAVADAVVLPYRRAVRTGVAHLALATHRPVVATTVGALPELFGRWTVPPGEPAALAETINGLLYSPGVPLPELGPGPDEVAARTETLYEAVLRPGEEPLARR